MFASGLFIFAGSWGNFYRAPYLLFLFWVGPKSAPKDYPIPHSRVEAAKLGTSCSCKIPLASPAFSELRSLARKLSLTPRIFIPSVYSANVPQSSCDLSREVSSLWLRESDFPEHPMQAQGRHMCSLPIGWTSQFIQQTEIWW